MPAESPLFFGMHPNAEIDFRTKMPGGPGIPPPGGFRPAARPPLRCETIFELLQLIQPKRSPGEEHRRA